MSYNNERMIVRKAMAYDLMCRLDEQSGLNKETVEEIKKIMADYIRADEARYNDLAN